MASKELLVMVMAAMVLCVHVTEAKMVEYNEKLGPYYQHDIVSRPNFTDLVVSRGYQRLEGFGMMSVFDDPVTATPNLSSELVGRAQGVQTMVSLDETNALITQSVHLPGGTLTFMGQFSVSTESSRLHCIGGTGDYEAVTQGYLEIRVHSFNPITLDAVLIITIYYSK